MRILVLALVLVAVVAGVGSQRGGSDDDDDDDLDDLDSIMHVGPVTASAAAGRAKTTKTKRQQSSKINAGSGQCAAGKTCSDGSKEPIALPSERSGPVASSLPSKKKKDTPSKKTTLPWPCNSISGSTLLGLREDNFTGLVAAAAERGTRELLFETLITTRPASNTIASDGANVHNAYLTSFDWVQHGDEFYCRAEKYVPTRRAKNCTGWSKLTASAPWTVVASGSTVGVKDLDRELSKFPHLYNPRRRPGSPPVPGAEFRTWVVAGGDIPEGLVTDHGHKILESGYFGRILVEGLTHPFTLIDGVGVAPIGLTELYLSRLAPSALVDQMKRADRLFSDKSGLFAGWGAYYGFLDDHIASRKSADKWLKSTPLATREMVPQGVYFARLAESRFSLCPAGRGVQSPKIMEALLTKTIPITPRDPAFVELSNLGFPLVAIDSWDSITAAKLDEWWTELSPRLNDARWVLHAEVWAAFVLHPCPKSVTSFVAALKSGKCPKVQCT